MGDKSPKRPNAKRRAKSLKWVLPVVRGTPGDPRARRPGITADTSSATKRGSGTIRYAAFDFKSVSKCKYPPMSTRGPESQPLQCGRCRPRTCDLRLVMALQASP